MGNENILTNVFKKTLRNIKKPLDFIANITYNNISQFGGRSILLW